MPTKHRKHHSRKRRKSRKHHSRHKYRMDPPSYGEDFPPPYPSQQQMEIYRTQIAQYVNEITGLQNRIGSLTELLDRTRTTDDAAINDLRQEIQQLRQRYIQSTIRNQQLQTQNQQLQTRNRQLESRLEAVQQNLRMLQRQNNTINVRFRGLIELDSSDRKLNGIVLNKDNTVNQLIRAIHDTGIRPPYGFRVYINGNLVESMNIRDTLRQAFENANNIEVYFNTDRNDARTTIA